MKSLNLQSIIERRKDGCLYFVGSKARVSSLFGHLAAGMSYDEFCRYYGLDRGGVGQVIEAAGQCFNNGIGLASDEPDPRATLAKLHTGSTFRRYELHRSGVWLDLLWGTLSNDESLFAFCDQRHLEPSHAMDISQIIRVAGEMLERSFSHNENPH